MNQVLYQIKGIIKTDEFASVGLLKRTCTEPMILLQLTLAQLSVTVANALWKYVENEMIGTYDSISHDRKKKVAYTITYKTFFV